MQREVTEQEFAAFFEKEAERAHRLAWRLVGGDGSAAEDVAQDAFVKALRALPGFRGDAKLSTWFFRILVREASNHRRWAGLRRLWADPDAEVERQRDRLEVARDPIAHAQVRAALDRLTGMQRQVFVLARLEGFTAREVAELLGKSEGTIKTHLRRALASLRADLAALVEAEDASANESE